MIDYVGCVFGYAPINLREMSKIPAKKVNLGNVAEGMEILDIFVITGFLNVDANGWLELGTISGCVYAITILKNFSTFPCTEKRMEKHNVYSKSAYNA